MCSVSRFLGLIVSIAILLLAGSGCASLKKIHLFPKRVAKPARTREAPAPRAVGTVTLVNEEDGFVLIDTAMAAPPVAGTALKSFTGTTESGVVSVGNVQRRPFVIADIVKGAPKKGDQVFQ